MAVLIKSFLMTEAIACLHWWKYLTCCCFS